MSKNKVYLILSPLDNFFPKNFEGKIIYLGNKNYPKLKSKNEKAKINRITTTWGNKETLIKDNTYLSELEENFFLEIYKTYNKVFGTNHNEKYWSLILRPTIFIIITFLFERWKTIVKIKDGETINKADFFKKEYVNLVTHDLSELSKKICDCDLFNQLLYQEIINFNKIKIEQINYHEYTEKKENRKKIFIFKLFRKIKIKNFIYLFHYIFNYISNEINIMKLKKKKFIYFNNDFLSEKLQKKLLNFFSQSTFNFKIKNKKINNVKVDEKLRNNFIKNFNFDAKSNFENFLKASVFRLIPMSLLEFYPSIKKFNQKYKQNYKVKDLVMLNDEIFSNNYFNNEWLAHNYGNGAKLFFLQNGGGPSTAEFNSVSEILKKIPSTHLHFGKYDDIDKNYFGVGQYRFPKKNIKFNKNGKVLYTLFTPYGYGNIASSIVPISDEWNDYISSQISFLNILPEKIKSNLEIRIKKRHNIDDKYYDYFDINKQLRKSFPNIKFDDYSQPLESHFDKTRLIITTLNTTTILQTLSQNIPTIMMFDLNKYKLSKDALESFFKLHEAGIINYSPEKTKIKISEIFEDVSSWWFSEKVQKNVKDFCKKYSYYSEEGEDYFINKLSSVLK